MSIFGTVMHSTTAWMVVCAVFFALNHHINSERGKIVWAAIGSLGAIVMVVVLLQEMLMWAHTVG